MKTLQTLNMWSTRAKNATAALLFLAAYTVSMVAPFLPAQSVRADPGSTHQVVCHRLGNGGFNAIPPDDQSGHIPGHVDVNNPANSDYVIYAVYPNDAKWSDLKPTLDAQCASQDPATPHAVTAPTSVDVCGVSSDTFTVPTDPYATYTVNGTSKAAGTYAGIGSVTIVAVPKAYIFTYNGHTYSLKYTLTPPTQWVFNFSSKSCNGSVTVTKVVTNKYGGIAVATDFKLYVNATQVTTGVASTFAADQVYTVSEGTGPAGYTQTSLSCVNLANQQELGATFTLAADENVSCVIKNQDQPATLIVKKHVVNDNGGQKQASDFMMKVTGTAVSSSSFSGSEAGTSITLSAGQYTVDEVQDMGYTKTLGSDCSGTIKVGETKTCTITNDDISPTLTLVKVVKNDNGGTAKPTDWTLSAADAKNMTVVSGLSGEPSTTAVAVNAGSYTLAESNGPSGYTSQGWVCEGATLVGSTVTLGLADKATCTVTNNDIAPYLQLLKVVVNDDGGSAKPAAWTLSATGSGAAAASSFSGTTGVNSANVNGFQVGSYTLAESTGPSGYDASAWSCQDGTVINNVIALSLGQRVVCTITNNDKPGTITVIKNVDDGFGHVTKDVKTWTWNYDGQRKSKLHIATGSNNAQTVPAGTYTVSEDQKSGYQVIASRCTDDGGWGENDRQSKPSTSQRVTVGLGKNVTCEFTNKRDTGTITVHKKIGNKLDPRGWTWWIQNSEADNAMGETVKVPTGTYRFGENQKPGYSFESLRCREDEHSVWVTQNVTATITIGKNDHIECTFTNSRDTGNVTIIKDAQPDSSQGFVFTLASVATDEGWNGSDGSDFVKQNVITGDNSDSQPTWLKPGSDSHGTMGTKTFTLVDNGGNAGGNSYSTILPTGKYRVSETPVSGWDLSNISCGETAEAEVTDGVLYLYVTKGVKIVCTFTNTKRAELTIVKDVQPGTSSKMFSFTTNAVKTDQGADTTFSLSDDGTGLLNSKQFHNLLAGTYTVTEQADSAWKLSDIVCTGTGVTMTRDAAKLMVTLAAGAVASCTFVNSFIPQVLGETTAVPTSPQPTLVNTGTGTFIATLMAFVLTTLALAIGLGHRKQAAL